MRRVTLTDSLTMAAAVVFLIMMAGPALAQPQVSDVDLGAVSHNQPDNADMGVSYTLMGADATRTAVAWYRDGSPVMDLYMVYEGDASNALLDLSGNGQTVVASGDVTAPTAWDATGGRDGGGAYLYSAGSGNRFYLDAGTVMNTSAYTKALWLKRTGTSSSHNILSSNTTTGGHILFAGGSAANKVTAFHVGQAVRVADPVTLVNGVWYHYAVTYQASDGAMILYRNGVQVASGTAPAFTDQSLLIGSFTPLVGNQWGGYLDDVRIYDHVLSPEQILALYNGPDTIRATETTAGEDWYAEITPSSSTAMGSTVESNTLTIATDPPIVGDIPGEVVIEDAAFAVINLDTYVTDADHADNQIAWTYTGNTDLSVDITTGQATITAPSDWFGSEAITFRATDPLGNYNEDAATFEATSVNDPPELLDISGQTVTEGSPFGAIDLNLYVTDVDNLTSEMNWTSSGNSILTVIISGLNIATITAPVAWIGTETITFTATDPGLLSGSDPADFTIVPDDPPTVAGVDLNSTSGNDYTEDDLDVTYSLGGGATSAAISWYKDDQPLMELLLPFEGGPNNALSDLSGNANVVTMGANATTTLADAWSAGAGRGVTGAFTFGSSFYLDAGNIFPTVSSYSKFCWIYKTADNSSLNIMSGSQWAGGGGHVLYASGSQGHKLTASHNNVAALAQDDVPLELNTWYHVGVTFDYATGEMILYKDGQAVDTAIVVGADKEVTDDVLLIGSLTDGPGNQWLGQIDNARLFNYAVSPAQVAEFYATGGDVIKSDETTLDDDWYAVVTPLSSTTIGTGASSDTITIMAPCCVMRGDVNDDSSVDVADMSYLVAFLFRGGPPATCEDHADMTNDDSIDVLDLTVFVNFQFKGGPALVPCD